MPKISGLGLGEIKKISGLGLGTGGVKKVSGLGLGLLWQGWPYVKMTKTTPNHSQGSNGLAQILNFIADNSDTTVSGGSGLVMPADGVVTINATMIFTGASFAKTAQLSLRRGASVLATGVATSVPSSGAATPVSVTGTGIAVTAGDVITIWNQNGSGVATLVIAAGTGSYVEAYVPS